MAPEKIIISRTDNLGDVMLTLPVAGVLKKQFPSCKIYFIGKSYTKALIETCIHVDEFIDREQVVSHQYLKEINADVILHIFPDKAVAKAASQAGVQMRVGTSHRWFHWLYCNKHVNFSRKKSDLHEAQLNLKLLQPLGITQNFSLQELASYTGFQKVPSLPEKLKALLQPAKFNLILHPKSKGSAREWPMENYFQLAQMLSPERYSIYITGTEKEGELVKQQKPGIFSLPHVTDLTGKCTLEELIAFIAQANGLLACSTGPLHIAAALGKHALGIYPPMRPIHPGRWAPLGKNAVVLVDQKNCEDCRKDFNCHCIRAIEVVQVAQVIEGWN
ncbi:MAG TPA: glycosyltransferase family 9 protein [Cytophagaceae bacterium]|nr:glycosyltransferase family 9 protein [Cytophagaceae bacterium]